MIERPESRLDDEDYSRRRFEEQLTPVNERAIVEYRMSSPIPDASPKRQESPLQIQSNVYDGEQESPYYRDVEEGSQLSFPLLKPIAIPSAPDYQSLPTPKSNHMPPRLMSGVYIMTDAIWGTTLDLHGGDNTSAIAYDMHGGENQQVRDLSVLSTVLSSSLTATIVGIYVSWFWICHQKHAQWIIFEHRWETGDRRPDRRDPLSGELGCRDRRDPGHGERR